MRQSWLLAPAFLAPFTVASLAHAEQYQIVDVTYTHSSDTTMDSHYYPMLPSDVPKDWTSPTDYSQGSVHIIVDVKTKPPGDAKTKFQICFEGNSAGCTLQSPTYTKTGRVEWDSPFADFWFEGSYDWSQGVRRVALILKDDMNNKPAGDAKYMPTELHVQVVLVSEGATFMASSDAGQGGAGGAGGAAASGGSGGRGGAAAGGTGGASGMKATAGSGGARPEGGAGGRAAMAAAASAGAGGAGAANGVKTGASAGQASTKPAVRGDAGRMSAGSAGKTAAASGGAGGARATTQTSTSESQVGPMLQSSSGCSSTGSGGNSGGWFLLGAAWLTWRRRRAGGAPAQSPARGG